MILNGRKLYDARPLSPMSGMKLREHGVSYGLSEAGYDLRIKQAITLHPLRRFAIASTMERFNMPENFVAIVHDKSTWARRGLSVFNTVIEPGDLPRDSRGSQLRQRQIPRPARSSRGGQMNRSEILDTAKEYVTRDRAATHGDAEDNFTQVAEAWTWWLSERLSAPLTAYDVAQMMSLFKKARAKANKAHLDNFVDDAAYSALAGEIAQR
jgi:hypothetical protein